MITPNTRPPREVGDTWDGIAWRVLRSFGVSITKDAARHFAWCICVAHNQQGRKGGEDKYAVLMRRELGVSIDKHDAFSFCDECYLDITPPQYDELVREFGPT